MKRINVTKSYLPPFRRYMKYLEKVWSSGQLTNNGPLVLELEDRLKTYLSVKHLFFVSNGTIAIQLAIKALEVEMEVITTPFSYVATTSSIVWEGCTPKYVDIDPLSLCIDTDKIEKAITKRTQAILPVHVYGYPCDVEGIQRVAKKFRLHVIYDAAHAFGVRYKGESILNYGDISTLSFHATKLFHTAEGGAVTTNNDKLAHKISYLRNFGHNGPEKFFGIGINGKNSELHAAMGLSILPDIKTIIRKRKQVSALYTTLLDGIQIRRPQRNRDLEYNYAYYPVIFSSEQSLLNVRAHLMEDGIYPRRYYYPALNRLNYVTRSKCPIAEDIAKRVLCLPLYPDLKEKDVRKIVRIIKVNAG